MGTAVNVLAILGGSAVGLLFRAALPKRVIDTVMQGVALFVVFIGIRMAASADYSALTSYFVLDGMLVVLGCVLIGGVIGSLLRIEEWMNGLGAAIEKRFSGGSIGNISRGFVAASLLYCIGPMAIVGSINDALMGDITTLATKAVLDGVASIALASTLGVGVALSAGAVLVYQGAITLTASAVQPILLPPVIQAMQGIGGILVMGIGMNILGIARIKLGDLLPSLFVVLLAIAFRAAAVAVRLI